MIKAVLFDMNGIIIDDEHIHETAFVETVKPFNVDLSHEAYLELCMGKTDRAGYEKIAEHFSVDLPIDELLKKKSEKYLELFPANKKDYPGVIELIYDLAEHFVLAIVSSSSRAEVDVVTKEFDIEDKFKITISADDITRGKPDPEPYRTALQELDVQPEGCVVIEDSKSGVLSAKAAGCCCIGVTTTHTENDLEDADLVVGNFYQITPEIIKQLKTKS